MSSPTTELVLLPSSSLSLSSSSLSLDIDRTEYHYSGYFAVFYGPCLFVIGLSTVILTALQLAVQVDIEAAVMTESSIAPLKSFCRFVGYSSVVITSLVAFYLTMLLVLKFCREWHFAIRERVRRREEALQERDRLYAKKSMV